MRAEIIHGWTIFRANLESNLLSSASSSDAAELQLARYSLGAGDPLPAGLADVQITGGSDGGTVGDFASALDRTYCGTMSAEFDAVQVREELSSIMPQYILK